MSRIRVIEAKVKNEILHSVSRKNEPDTTSAKDDVEKSPLEELLVKIPRLDKTFDIHRKIGEGTFSSVYLSTLRRQAGLPDSAKKHYAIKHHVSTTHPTRIAHELRCLRDIGGKNHVIGVDKCIRHLDNVVFIMPYMPHKKFSEYYRDMCTDELRRYMRALLTSLRHVHAFGVIHRDVKPSNFLYDRENQRYALVDFGLAQHMVQAPEPKQPPPAHQSLKRPFDDDSLFPDPKRVALDLSTRARPEPAKPKVLQSNVNRRADAAPACACSGLGGVCEECAVWAPPRANRSGTQGFRPPEVLLKYAAQTTAVDIWAAGVILASVLCMRYPFFRAADDMPALAEIMSLLGSDALQDAAATLGCRIETPAPRRGICLRRMAAHLRRACSPAPGARPPCECPLAPPHCVCRDLGARPDAIDATRSYGGFPDSAFSLAARLLHPNPSARITAAAALRHPFLQQ